MTKNYEIIAKLCYALRLVLGEERERWGYQAAANVMDDAIREHAFQAMEEGEKIIKNGVAD